MTNRGVATSTNSRVRQIFLATDSANDNRRVDEEGMTPAFSVIRLPTRKQCRVPQK